MIRDGPNGTMVTWFPYRVPRIDSTNRLLCFSHAGGSASAFRDWSARLPPDVDVCGAQLPGRERRLCEPRFTTMTALVEVLVGVVRPLLDRPFAIFGHSLGAHIGFALTRRLRALALPQPAHLFVAAAIAPHLPPLRPSIFDLSDGELVQELARLGGIPRPVLEDRDLLALTLPTVRADFELYDGHVHREEPPLDCPISAFGGTQDRSAPQGGIRAWSAYTRSRFSFRAFEGDHFFPHTAAASVLEAIVHDLRLDPAQPVVGIRGSNADER